MKKTFALLLALALMFSLAACSKDDGKTPSGGDIPPSSQQQEQEQQSSNAPAPGNDDKGGEEAGGSTIDSANAYLENRGFVGFTFPDDLTAVDISLMDAPVNMAGLAEVTFCPVENDRYEEILQALFSGTGMTVTNASGETVTSLDDVISPMSNDTMAQHSFRLVGTDLTYPVSVSYYPNGDGANAAQTLHIKIEHGMKK